METSNSESARIAKEACIRFLWRCLGVLAASLAFWLWLYYVAKK